MNGARFRRLLVAVHRGIGRRQQFADRAMPHRIVLLLANAMADLITALSLGVARVEQVRANTGVHAQLMMPRGMRDANPLRARKNRFDGMRETVDQVAGTAQMQRAHHDQRPFGTRWKVLQTRRPGAIACIENRLADAR